MKTAMKFSFYVDGSEIAFAIAHPSQVNKLCQLLTRLCRYAAHFKYNVQIGTEEWQQETQTSYSVKDKTLSRTTLLCELLQTICDATSEIQHENEDETYIPIFRYEPTFEFSTEDLQTIHKLAEEETQDYTIITDKINTMMEIEK